MRKDQKGESLITKFLNAEDPTRDVKLASYGLVTICGIVWLTWKAWGHELSDQWVNAFYGLCGLVGLGGVAGAAVDAIKGRSNAQTPKESGAKDQEGEP